MNFKQGRNNLSASIHVTTPCENGCPFCINKYMYERNRVNYLSYSVNCQVIANSDINEIVITGGEPTQDLRELKTLLNIFEDKTVFINTSLPKTNFKAFVELLKDYPNVKCINVSRHTASEVDESKYLRNIVSDSEIASIPCKVRINTVLTDDTDVQGIIDRWQNKYEISLRYDFRKTTKDSLHTLEGVPPVLLTYHIVQEGRCNVCHTTVFQKATLKKGIRFHKGLKNTSIERPSAIEVNDIILQPNGKLYYDWDGKEMNTKDFINAFTSSEDDYEDDTYYNNCCGRIGKC